MNVSIIGCGAYGLALGSILYKNKCNIKYWTFDKNEKEFLEKNRESNKLKDFIIPNDVNFSCNMKEVIENSVLIIIAVPAFAFDNVSIEISKYLKKNQHVLIATKGIEQDTCMFLNEVFKKYPYFSKLLINNSLITKNKEIKNIKDIEEIDLMIKSLYQINYDDIDVLLYNLLTVTGRILRDQYFDDGNSRTLKAFLRDYLEELGYYVCINDDDFVMPVLFEGETATMSDIIKFKNMTNIKFKNEKHR